MVREVGFEPTNAMEAPVFEADASSSSATRAQRQNGSILTIDPSNPSSARYCDVKE
jgi:hypothetical protein